MFRSMSRLASLGSWVPVACVLSSVLRAQGSGTEPYPPINEIPQDDSNFNFLTLGQDKDYLRAERWRIIDQIEQAIPPLYEPVLPFHGYTLPPGAWRIGLSTSVARNPGDFGRDDFYELFFDDVTIDSLRADLDVFYGFELGDIEDMTLRLNMPYRSTRISGTGHPWRIEPFEVTMEGGGEGLGDISLTLKKKWLDQGNGPATFSTMTGVIFPTANDHQKFSPSQTLTTPAGSMDAPPLDIFGTEPGEQLLPRSAQPGNGAWGLRLGFGATHQFERSALHEGAVFDYLFDTEDDITPGHELRYGLSYVVPPFDNDRWTLDLSIFGMWKGDEEFPGTVTHPVRDPNDPNGGPLIDPVTGMPVLVTTGRPDFEHGNFTFVSPSAIYIPSPGVRFVISPAIRILEPNHGPSPEWMLTVGLTFTY